MSEYRKFIKEELDATEEGDLKTYYETLMLFLQGKRSKKKMHEAAISLLKA